jgi:hypothetical protein
MDGWKEDSAWMDGFSGADDSARMVWRKEAVDARKIRRQRRDKSNGESESEGGRGVCHVLCAANNNVGERVDTVGSRTICVSSAPDPAGHIKPAAPTFE